MVERDLRGAASKGLARARQAAIGEAAKLTGEGTPLRCLRSVFAPEEGRCFCLFDASGCPSTGSSRPST